LALGAVADFGLVPPEGEGAQNCQPSTKVAARYNLAAI